MTTESKPLSTSSAQFTPQGTKPDSVRKLGLGLRTFPIFFFIAYLSFTIFLFAYGPWPYPVKNGLPLYTYLALAHLALFTGYLSAALGKPRGYFGKWRIESILKLSVLVNLVLLWPTLAFRTGQWLPNLKAAILDPGAAYGQSNIARLQAVPVVEYIRIFAGPLLFWLLPLTIFYRRRLKKRLLGLAGLLIMGNVLTFVAMGTNKGIADTVLLGIGLLLAGHYAQIARISPQGKRRLVIGGSLVMALFLVFFARGMATRSGSGALYGYFSALQISADPENFMVRGLPASAQVGIYGLTSYLTQGYYALYLSLKEPFIPTFGVGHSMFLVNQVADLPGLAFVGRLPFPMRIEKYGWNAYGLWSSIYPWIASDVSFPGTLLVVFIIGRLFAQTWLDTLRGENPFAVAAFAQFLIMLFYFPANNQVLQSGESWTAFVGTLILWRFTRRKYVLR